MEAPQALNTLANDAVTIVGILAIAFVALNGASSPEVVGAIAGLGGYRMHKASKG